VPQGAIALAARNRYIRRHHRFHCHPGGEAMRAETQKVVDEIKQSVGLLRRHL
jgi:hypothetical protein